MIITKSKECVVCHGHGWYIGWRYEGELHPRTGEEIKVKCWHCDGRGEIIEKKAN